MDNGDTTAAPIRGLLNLPERPPAQGRQIHDEIDGEGDKQVEAPEFHAAPVDTCQIALPGAVEHEQDAPEEETVRRAEDETRDEKPLKE